MPRSLTLYLDDLLKACDRILSFTVGLDLAAYEDSELVRSAVERQFLIIGEALSQMRQHHPSAMQQIEEAHQIIGFRNVLAHQYLTIDNEDVWSAVQSKLPDFRQQVAALIAAIANAPQP